MNKKILKSGLMIAGLTVLSSGLINSWKEKDNSLTAGVVYNIKAGEQVEGVDKEELDQYLYLEEELEEVEEVEETEEVEELEEVEKIEEVEDLFDEVYYNSIIEELTKVKKQVKDLEGYIEDLEQLRLQEEAKIIK